MGEPIEGLTRSEGYMAELIIGALAAMGFLLLTHYVRLRNLRIAWWQWAITLLGFLYGVFVLEVVVSFMREGTPKGAAVMGTLLGFFAVLWGVVLGRTVFAGKKPVEVSAVGGEGSGPNV
jgi:hypothetical protein